MEKASEFLKRKNIEISLHRYGIQALGSMAQGLFATLIIGLILKVIGENLGIPFLYETIYPAAVQMTGPAIAVAVAYGLQAPPLVLFASTITGMVGNQLGGPVGAFVAAVVGAEFGKMVSKETKVDILVTPAVTIVWGVLAGILIGPAVSSLMTGLGRWIMWATELHPVPMGMFVSVLMGMALTLPISSAALAIMLGLSGLAGGAATVGCSTQMVGFAIASYKENGWGGLLSQGLGTSMLQVPNIVKNPLIWVPPTLASAIIGPFATAVFRMENTPEGAGMGTSGFVGQFGTVAAMGANALVFAKMFFLHIVAPAVITLIIAGTMRKAGFIREGDMKLPD